MVPSESRLRFSELSAVPIEASDSRVSSSDARGSRVSISNVNSSLQRQTSRLTHELNTHDETRQINSYFRKFCEHFLQNCYSVDLILRSFTNHVTFSEHFRSSDSVYFSFCRLSICSVNTLSSCCMAAC